MTLSDAKKTVSEILGEEPGDMFVRYVKDLNCYAKALAFINPTCDNDQVRDRLKLVCQGILAQISGFFLRQNHSDDRGNIDINLSEENIYDRDMNLIKPIRKLSEKQLDIMAALVREAMKVFLRGQVIAKKVVERYDSINGQPGKSSTIISTRDYNVTPPREVLEIEIMDLEGRLPNLSAKEGLRLSLLYESVLA